jgi:hypothetical protein
MDTSCVHSLDSLPGLQLGDQDGVVLGRHDPGVVVEDVDAAEAPPVSAYMARTLAGSATSTPQKKASRHSAAVCSAAGSAALGIAVEPVKDLGPGLRTCQISTDHAVL